MDRDEELRRRRGEHTRSYSQDRPIGSGENASALIRGIKQWLPDIPGSVGDLVDMAYAGGRNVLQGQKQRSIPSLGLGEKARKLVKQRPALEQVQMTETPETNWFEEGARMLNPAMFMSPKNIATMGGLALAGGVPGASMAIIKPRGGNWFTGSGSELESAIKGLMKGSTDNYRTLLAKGMIDEAAVKAKPEYALNKWLEGPLTRYLRRDLGTEADPIRKLLEGDRPVSHMRLDELQDSAGKDWISRQALRNRATAGLPNAGVGQSGPSQAWETLTDAMIGSSPAGETFKLQSQWDSKHPMAQDWVSKLPEDSPIYDFIGDEAPDWLGLPHLRDELWNAVREDSDLPNALKLKPEDFQQMGIEKAIRHVANINDWRATQKAQANLEMLNGPAVKLVREYPENNPKGLRWVELNYAQSPEEFEQSISHLGPKEWDQAIRQYRESNLAALQNQLKYEGDTMGHCVGGYCKDVLFGDSKIFSLRDAKGEPHVTIEVAPGASPELLDLRRQAEAAYGPLRTKKELAAWRNSLSDEEYDKYFDLAELVENGGALSAGPRIIQIKGKQNKAPKADYLPFVQDFLKKPYHGGEWDPDIGDLGSTGLITTTKGLFTPDEAYKMLTDPAHKDLQKELLQTLEADMFNNPKYPEYDRLLNGQGYANGGLVGRQDFNGVVGYILD